MFAFKIAKINCPNTHPSLVSNAISAFKTTRIACPNIHPSMVGNTPIFACKIPRLDCPNIRPRLSTNNFISSAVIYLKIENPVDSLILTIKGICFLLLQSDDNVPLLEDTKWIIHIRR